ncbi:hypothetical protein [Antrihabitans cavernicola]|uniref:Uncharacterized protein n=1 Tax=Antrihabitans cavernicola TaxID=2495913 RepID=A0A5A7SEM2_9NOCA|nr:hypothetical protein [Spelaeibacter cavernicola]KAA0023157.1 hypothetical protein FOY51_11875 [Spelaeibacter cavernicola]
MPSQDGNLPANLMIYAVVALVPAATVWLAFHASGLIERGFQLSRRRAVPAGPPIARLAADLRRLDQANRDVPPGTSMVRRRGVQMAYDDVLRDACRALDVPESLATVPEGLDKELERTRVQLALRAAGLVF